MWNKLDRRTERTKRDLKNALLSLMEEKKSINTITITNISKLANYNRATFYAHYPDKETLLNEIMEDAMNGFIESFRTPYKDQVNVLNMKQLTHDTIKIFDYVEKNASLFAQLFNNKLFPSFQHQLCNAIEKVYKEELELIENKFQAIDKELFIHIEAYSLIAMLDFWIKNDFKYTAQYMTEQLLQRINYSIENVKVKKQ